MTSPSPIGLLSSVAHLSSAPMAMNMQVCICVVTFLDIQVCVHMMDLYEVKIDLMLSHAVLDEEGGSCVCRLRSAEQKKGERESI